MLIKQGADYAVTFEYQNKDGSIFPLTDYTAKMQIKQGFNSIPLVTLTDAEDDGLVILAGAGSITVEIGNVDTAKLPGAPVSLLYDLYVTSPNDVKYKVIGGRVLVQLAVTQ